MKEQFDKRRLQGSLNVACKYDDGTVRHWNTRKEIVIQQIIEITNYYQQLGYKLTLRQLHYQFVSRNWIVNHDTAYKKLGKILDDCRYGGLVDWNSFEDRGRVPHLAYYVDGVVDAIDDAIRTYRLDRQAGQDTHVEVWTEKDALTGIMKRTTDKYGIRLVVNKGYTSSSAIYSAYTRFVRILEGGQSIKVLYFGDHDPSGLDMVRDIRERLEFMFANGEQLEDKELAFNFDVEAIGLTKKQIKEHKCPPNPTKLTDSRAAGYIAQHGKTCWEVDALNPEVLTEIVESNIQSAIDCDIYEEILLQETKDKQTLKNATKDVSK